MSKNEEKFSRIYDDCVGQIYRFVFLRVGTKETAQDLTSEAFARFWRVFDRDSEKIENPRAFLYKTAKNLVADYYRAKGNTPIVSTDLICDMLIDQRADFEKKAEISSDMELVRKAMSHLNDDYQNAIIWRFLDDLSIKEVSHLLDRSEEATRVLLHRAIKELKNRLS